MRRSNLQLAAGCAACALLVACAPPDTPDAPDAPAARVVEHFEMLQAADAFSGAVLVARGDEIVVHRGFGLADREHGVPIGTDGIFRIGSLTKPVTAAAVLISVDRGRMSLDDLICEALDPCPSRWASVTVKHLLTHTSGIPDHFGDLEAVPVEATAAECRRVLAGLGEGTLRSEPGAEYAYSNFNYVLLGLALESAHGEPWEAVLDRLMFEPLGLDSMGYDDVRAILPGRVRGYDRDDAGRIVHIDYDDHAAYAAGGLRSTIGDFFRWSRAAIAGELLSDDLRAEAFTPYRERYGYGWQIRDLFERRMYNHTGGIDGFSTHIAHYPDEDLTIVVFGNVASDSAMLRACETAYILFDWAEPPRTAEGWAALEPRAACGLERPAPTPGD